TQISREEIPAMTLPPAGELGLLKRQLPVSVVRGQESVVETSDNGQRTAVPAPTLSTLLDYLPRETLFLLCQPESLSEHAGHYSQQVPASDPFFVTWEAFQAGLAEKGMTALEVSESEISAPGWEIIETIDKDAIRSDAEQPATRLPAAPLRSAARNPQSAALLLSSLDPFRPLSDRAAEPQIGEAQ